MNQIRIKIKEHVARVRKDGSDCGEDDMILFLAETLNKAYAEMKKGHFDEAIAVIKGDRDARNYM